VSADGEQVSERGVLTTVLLAAAIALALLVGLLSIGGEANDDRRDLAEKIPPEVFVGEIAQHWVDAWTDGDDAAMQKLAVAPAADLDEEVASFRDGLHITALRASPRAAEVHGTTATVALDIAADIQALGTWVFTGHLSLVLPPDAESPDAWRVQWSRQALHPALTGTRTLAVTRSFAPRAPLLAADGTPLTGEGARPTPGLAGQLVGRVGTTEAASDDRLPGDPAGTSGLQAAFDVDLGGGASGDVVVREGDSVVEMLDHIDGRAPAPVRTSIDLRMQAAAESVLATVVDHPAALVAIRPSTGEVTAVASSPPRGFNRALQGRYPPGSTFKVVTSTALLAKDTTPDSPTTCPHDVTVNGRVFQNAEDEELGDIPFRQAFAHSCNTAFVQLAEGLEPSELTAAAELLGFNQPSPLEVPAAEPSFPELHGLVDQVSSAIGQGRVLTTPLQMASVAATVASGTRRPPTFRQVTAPPAGTALPVGIAATLQELMRMVVTEGTAASAGLPPGTAGKTGTAEFGTADPPQTHAWFIGFRGDLAFAVIVEDGGFGGAVAAPLARQFLRQLPG
jgi:hypothetical protein